MEERRTPNNATKDINPAVLRKSRLAVSLSARALHKGKPSGVLKRGKCGGLQMNGQAQKKSSELRLQKKNNNLSLKFYTSDANS